MIMIQRKSSIFIPIIFIWLHVKHLQCQNGSYVIVGPSVIRPGLDYNLVVNIIDSNVGVNVEAKIVKSNGNEIEDIVSGVGDFSSDKFGQLSLKVPQSLGQGSYSLIINADANLLEKQSELNFDAKSASIFVQLDKAKYKPSDIVQYRIILVNPFLIPVKDQIDYFILDPNGNRIKQEFGIGLYKGLYSSSLKLSDQAVLGQWRIVVNYRAQSYSKEYLVEEYVLPKYEIKLNLPSYALLTNRKSIKIVGSFSAKYTFGGSVKGSLVLSLKDLYGVYLQSSNKYVYEEVSQSLSVNGDVNFELVLDISLNNYLKPEDFNYAHAFAVNAMFVDELTGKNNSLKEDVSVYNWPYKLVLSAPVYYKQGIPYNLEIKVLQVDDKPLAKPKDFDVEIKVSYNLLEPIIEAGKEPIYQKSVQDILNIPISGYLKVPIIVAADNISDINIEAKFVDFIQPYYLSSSRFDEPSLVFIEIEKVDKLYKIDESVSFKVFSNYDLNRIVYVVLSRGVVLSSSYVQHESPQSEFVIKIAISAAMAPRSILVVYAVHDGNIIADSLNIQVDGYSKNFVKMAWDAVQKKPQDSARVSIKTAPESLVGVLTVDKSVLLLAKGNDIYKDGIIDEINSYNVPQSQPFRGGGIIGGVRPLPRVIKGVKAPIGEGKMRKKRRSLFVPWFAGQTSYDIIKDAGLIVVSDASLHQNVINYPMYMLKEGIRAPQVADAGPKALADIKIRSDFPETWVWFEKESDKAGYLNYSRIVPDSITSWVSSVISLNDIVGLAIGENLPDLKVVLPFFALLNIPYSVVRGENVRLQVIVFNYLGKSVSASVSLKQTPDFSAIGKLVKSVKVASNSGANVFFNIRPKLVGNLKLNIVVKAPSAGDAIEQFLKVKAEGQQLFFNKPFLITIPKNVNEVKEKVNISWPKEMVPGSNSLQATAIGDVMGPTLSNIGSLIRLPYGCGEQNMLNFAPNVYIYRYLKIRGLLSAEILVKLKDYSEQGYQRELTYQRSDGSFSAFGNSDPIGSIWLTAFVVKSFVQAADLIYIDPNIIKKAIEFIVAHQNPNGSFVEVGNVIHKEMQGGSSASIPISAYVFEALLEALPYINGSGVYSSVISLAASYLTGLIDDNIIATNPYQLAIVCYALHVHDPMSSVAEEALNQLNALSKIDNGQMFWSDVSSIPTCSPNQYCYAPVSLDFEMTSYALLSYAIKNLVSEGIPIMRWLIGNRNAIGGFSSSQDTCVGLLALSEFVALFSPSEGDLSLLIKGASGESHSFNISSSNSLVYNSALFKKAESSVKIVAQGSGSALVQISWSYNIPNTLPAKGFSIDVKVASLPNNALSISICVSYLGEGQSNMAILEINAPSGYIIDDSIIDQSIGDVKKVEVLQSGTKVDIYYNSLSDAEICPVVRMDQQYLVADIKPSEIKISDYYSPEFFAIGKLVVPP